MFFTKKNNEAIVAKGAIDIHTHLLPFMDDGSESVEQSLEMLKMLSEQGVETVAATPHFDALITSPEDFLKRRGDAEAAIRSAMDRERASYPKLILGAEVTYFSGISRCEEIKSLCLGESDILLLEMPFSPWSESVLNEITLLGDSLNIKVLLAHIDRYFSYQSRESMRRVFEQDLLFQINMSAFIDLKSRKKAFDLLDSGSIDFLGSDCHNTSSRAPNFSEALSVIKKRKRVNAFEALVKYSSDYFELRSGKKTGEAQ